MPNMIIQWKHGKHAYVILPMSNTSTKHTLTYTDAHAHVHTDTNSKTNHFI